MIYFEKIAILPKKTPNFFEKLRKEMSIKEKGLPKHKIKKLKELKK